MPSLKDIRRRIASVRKTQQITRAMRMVSAAKLRRAQNAIESARDYADRMRDTLAEVAASGAGAEQPLLLPHRAVQRIEYVLVTSDRGLCGAFNSNVIKRAEIEIAGRRGGPQSVGLVLVGRKGAEYFRRRRPGEVVKVFSGISRAEYGHAVEIADFVAGRFLAGETHEVVIVNSVFVSTLTQRPRVARLLPMIPEEATAREEERHAPPYEIEPDARRLLEVLAPKALQTEIFRALLDNQAGEHASRMTAMESATRNTEEMIDGLTLQYNRARQAAITKELVEIVSGAEAL